MGQIMGPDLVPLQPLHLRAYFGVRPASFAGLPVGRTADGQRETHKVSVVAHGTSSLSAGHGLPAVIPSESEGSEGWAAWPLRFEEDESAEAPLWAHSFPGTLKIFSERFFGSHFRHF